MSELDYKKIDVFSLSLDGFEGPIDLLLSLARDHKIDLTKLSILSLAEQYLKFLDQIIKKDIDIAAEYLVMGAWLAFLKSKLLLPDDKEKDSMTSEEMSELLEFQMNRLEGMQKVSKLLFKRPKLGRHFFKRGNPEIFGINQKNQYNLSLYDLIKTYGDIITFNNNKSITIAETQLYSVEDALNTLKSFFRDSKEWKDLLDFIPNNLRNKLERKSALASHFVASLELVKEGSLQLRQDSFNDNVLLIPK
tara:strand:+ start:465 stop:1211 length:747 start_codon:yes stop_codon:yes gene_type:complete